MLISAEGCGLPDHHSQGNSLSLLSETTLHVCLVVVVLYGAVLSLTAKTSVWHLLVNKHQCNSKDSTMHAPFDSTKSFFPSKTNYTKMSKVLCLTSAVSTKIPNNFFNCNEDRNTQMTL